MPSPEAILKQYDEKHLLYKSFGEKCRNLILDLLKDNNIPIHLDTCRLKDKDSLSKKINRKNDKYSILSDITDICGIRIITYLESNVDRVAEIIEKEFEIDKENSIDKRQLKADQFGYRSLHYVISLSPERLKLSENKKYIGFKLEVQVRSILQHAWAEIEHDLGYKSTFNIPEEIKRRFNRIAALLETADVEFDRLKESLSQYEDQVRKDIIKNPSSVKVNLVSIDAFLSENQVMHKARVIIKKNINCVFYSAKIATHELSKLSFFGITNIAQIEDLVQKNEKDFLAFEDELSKSFTHTQLADTLPLVHFQHFLAAQKQDLKYMLDYLKYGDFVFPSYVAERLLDIYLKTMQ